MRPDLGSVSVTWPAAADGGAVSHDATQQASRDFANLTLFQRLRRTRQTRRRPTRRAPRQPATATAEAKSTSDCRCSGNC